MTCRLQCIDASLPLYIPYYTYIVYMIVMTIMHQYCIRSKYFGSLWQLLMYIWKSSNRYTNMVRAGDVSLPSALRYCRAGVVSLSPAPNFPAHVLYEHHLACRDVTVLVLDRPRHEQIIKEVREAGARIKLISDGDVGGAIEVAKLSAPVDVLFGIGGTPEGT